MNQGVNDSWGIANSTHGKLLALFRSTPGIDQVWIYGSRARGDHRHDSDIDLMIDAPAMAPAEFARLAGRLEELALIYRVDMTHWQSTLDDKFRSNVTRDRKVFWAPHRGEAAVSDIGALEMKEFQRTTLERLGEYIDELNRERAAFDRIAAKVAMEPDLQGVELPDFPRKAWASLARRGSLPPRQASLAEHSSRFDGAKRPIPNICIKIPTGGGKTLVGAAAISLLQSRYLRAHTGLVLWVVPNEAIYTQTKKALANRDHPYRQLLNVAGAGRVKLLEKDSPLNRLDVDSNLCVMLLMLQSAARQSKETLRFFRDRGNVLGFFPREDDIEAHWSALQATPNLDVYAPFGASSESAARNKGSIIKDSLGNVMRVRRPIVVIDEGHHSYTENALRTIDGFNPAFVLELSATPRVAKKAGEHGANVLVEVMGTDLERADMIKLPINVDVRPWPDWRSCLTASVSRLDELQAEAGRLQGDTGRYIRPILLVQVERTGADQTDSGFIHAAEAEAHLLQLGFAKEEIAQKTSEKNELAQPENIDLLSSSCRIRAIITKQALQEGWDCPFAYVLCALSPGRNQAAMTQLVGRILRQPQVAKTGRALLDECYVYCHNVQTGTVVSAIKQSLEEEGMGDLTSNVRSSDADANTAKPVTIPRRSKFASTQIFLPRVTWRDGGVSRELVYDSDVLAQLDWKALQVDAIANGWKPPPAQRTEQQFQIGLEVLKSDKPTRESENVAIANQLDRVFVARAIGDLVPNTWHAFDIVRQVVDRLLASDIPEADIAAATALLVEQLRTDIVRQRDVLAESAFGKLVDAGNIQFRLSADKTAYEIPMQLEIELPQKPRHLTRPDGKLTEKSLFEPFYESMAGNDFETNFACYLDSAAAISWWHRNVARSQYGLQGWKRNKVYPDFVFLKTETDGKASLVAMETKGAHLMNEDTDYKRALFQRLTSMFDAAPSKRIGELELADSSGTRVVCDLVFDENWQNQMNAKYAA